jgi:hypothetical protein
MIIKIPIRVHLLKYLRGKIGSDRLEIKHYYQVEMFEDQSEIIHIQKEISRAIYPFLTTKHHWRQDQLGKTISYGMIALGLKDYLVTTKRIQLSYLGVLKLNSTIDEMMLQELIGKIDVAIAEKKPHDKTILEFMMKYNFDEDDIRYDSLKKRIYRERARLAEKLFLEKNLKVSEGVLDLSFGDKYLQT